MTTEELAAHVAKLCEEHGIEVDSHSSGGRAFRKSRRIKIRPVKTVTTYLVAMHEISHVVHQPAYAGHRLSQEAHAWDWAIENSLVYPRPSDWRMIARCLRSYLRKAERGKMVLPPKDHCLWAMLKNADREAVA